MEITEFAVKILVLFLPGIICTYLDDRNTNVKELSIVVTVVKSIIYSMISYGILWCIKNFIYYTMLRNLIKAPIISFFEFFNCSSNRIDFIEIFMASFIGILVSAFKTAYTNIIEECNSLAFCSNPWKLNKIEKKAFYINNLLKKLKIVTDGIGNKDVWDYVLTNQVTYVTVRDWDNNFAYMGKTKFNSSYNINGELYLEEVLIVDMDGYEADKYAKAVYLNKNDASSWDIIFNSDEEVKKITDHIDELTKSQNNFLIQNKKNNSNDLNKKNNIIYIIGNELKNKLKDIKNKLKDILGM